MGRRSLSTNFRIARSGTITITDRTIRKVSEGNRIMTDRSLFSRWYNSVASAEGLQIDEQSQ